MSSKKPPLCPRPDTPIGKLIITKSNVDGSFQLGICQKAKNGFVYYRILTKTCHNELGSREYKETSLETDFEVHVPGDIY